MRKQTTAKTEADPYGMTNKRTSNGNDKDKSWLGEVIHSHPWRDEAAPWMGHPCGYGGERRADRFAIAMGHPGKKQGQSKDEIQGSLHCSTDDKTVRCSGPDDVWCGGRCEN